MNKEERHWCSDSCECHKTSAEKLEEIIKEKDSIIYLEHPLCKCSLVLVGKRIHRKYCPIWPNNKELNIVPR